jgi:glycyl-tRNA synthetase alpha chain
LTSTKSNSLTFQQLILKLQAFYAERGAVIQQPYDVEVGAGTMAPETFLRVLGPNPYKVAYVQPSRRPADGRYGENPNRLFKHLQLQVILKPPPENVQELYLESLGAIGIDLRQHDIKFEEDNWESPTLGAWGIGWQVMLDGLEVTQFTYFQQCGGVDLDPISAELTYGLERLCAFLQDVDSIYDIVWARDPETGREAKYGEVRLADEQQFSVYNFEMADVEKTWKHFELCEAECKALLQEYAKFVREEFRAAFAQKNRSEICQLVEAIPLECFSFPERGKAEARYWGLQIDVYTSGGTGINTYTQVDSVRAFWPDGSKEFSGPFSAEELLLPNHLTNTGSIAIASEAKRRFPLLAAYDLCLKCSHYFNILDARGAISVTERVGVIARVRALAVGIAKAWTDQHYASEKIGKSNDAPEAAARDKKNRLEPAVT